MEFMYEYSAAHKFFLYLNSTPPTSSEATTSLVPPPPPAPPVEAYDQAAYYPTSSINDQELMMKNFQATDDHIHPPPQPLAEVAAAAPPFIPYNQVQFSECSSMLMDFSYINEDICSNNSYYVETSREAKVLRYKEKKKRRNYVKKIRYPSRKAYADRRPRIRGRFIKVLDEDEQPPIALNQYNQEESVTLNQYNQESTMAFPQYNCS